MSTSTLYRFLKAIIVAVTLLLLGAVVSLAQSVNITAGSMTATMPDGQLIPMWGYTCTGAVAPATCAAANPNGGGSWSPIVITVPPGSLTINLTNNLPVPPNATTGIPTSLIIVGQLGGGLGGAPTRTPSPNHPQQVATWPIAGTNPPPSGAPTFTPPPQSDRVQSFGTEVQTTGTGTAGALNWQNLRPGTYLIESGTHPSIQGPMGLYGVLVVTSAPSAGTQGTAYSSPKTVSYDADVPLVLSEIDPVQNRAVDQAVRTSGFKETEVWSGQPGGCGDPASAIYGTCYPPAVNYDPRYYLINGVAFDKTNPSNSTFSAAAPAGTGQVLIRFVNAGLRMHVPSVVGAQTGTPAVPGFSLIAEDGNVLPGNFKLQSEVFLAAGKAYDVMVNAPAGSTALPVFDRQLSLSTNNQSDGGMQGYISVNGGSIPATAGAVANPDQYFLVPGKPLAISDPAKGVIANDINVYGVKVLTPPSSAAANGFTLNSDGTFTYTPSSASVTQDSFTYRANGTSGPTATVTLAPATVESGSGITVRDDAFSSNVATKISVSNPGVLGNDSDAAGYPLTVDTTTITPSNGLTLKVNPDGSFTATRSSTVAAVYSFTYKAKNSQGTQSASAATVTINFPAPSGLAVHVYDAPSFAKGSPTAINDYRWIIEEDRTFQVNPASQVQNGCTPVPPATTCTPPNVATLGTNFHTSYMPVVASGCIGAAACESGQTVLGKPAVCDLGNGACRTDAAQQVPLDPSQVALDPNKHYYISILPGDAGNSFTNGGGAPVPVDPNNPNGAKRQFDISKDCNFSVGTGNCGHGMSGAPIGPGQVSVNVLAEQTPFPTAKIAVFVYEDDSPLNGEVDVHGGTDARGTSAEPGLGGFEITLFDDAGGTGDPTGQMTYDMFNMPLSNSLAGTKDQFTGFDACPISQTADGLVGRIVTCPHFESDGTTVSPLEGQVVIANMMPGRYGVVATPAADRIARGEEWLQTNTLDGQKAHDSFIKVGGPAYFQEFGPAGYHVAVGFANPATINARKAAVCANTTCSSGIDGKVTTARTSRTPDERIYSSSSNDALAFTQCYVSLGDPDDEDFAFAKCNPDGTFSFSNLPAGNWRVTVFDQWNDQIVDGLSTPVGLVSGKTAKMEIPVQHWHTNIYTQTYFDQNGNGIRDPNEPGLTLLPTNIRFRDGSYSNFNNTDLSGNAGFNEIFPLFNWYVLEADSTRYKQTGVHVMYDAGGPADGAGGGSSNGAKFIANTKESFPLPTALRVPGAVYCRDADCTQDNRSTLPNGGGLGGTTGRIDPPWVTTEGWQGFSGQSQFVEFGKTPFDSGENGGIKGEVIYASTRPFDDPALLIHTSWTPDVPGVTINLYQEGKAADGTQTLTLVDHTKTTSWDDWAQGFHLGSDGVTMVPNMNCPGQGTGSSDLFFFTLQNSRQWLNPNVPLPTSSQFKCYDGMHNFNQVQPAPYDGMYKFPSVTAANPTTGKPTGTNCTVCTPNPALGDGSPMLPAGKFVVEMIVPPGYELVKEEDKNILIGDNYIAPVTQQFGSLGSIFILPDQAEVNIAYNRNNPQNPTQGLGRSSFPTSEGDTGSVETFWPCVGTLRVVPDYISLFPYSHEAAPFAGASRNLCDRKEVTLEDQTSALAKFWVFSSTHVAAHFTGFILDDFSSEFDPFSPQFGEKFAVPTLPVSIKDFTGTEISRVYSDQWGQYNGLTYSTWEVNPPNPTGYAPTMMVTCMNDPGKGPTPDPFFNASYSQFCYENPFMPGQTQYMDTPVVPTAAFAEGYNPPDCAYPDATPAISTVTGDSSNGGAGPWVSAPGHLLTIKALGPSGTAGVQVPNNSYSGPSATAAPFNQKFLTRHYGFGTTQGTGSVTIGGVPANVLSWSDAQIQVAVPSLSSTQSTCPIAQRGYTSFNAATCGELVITSGNGKKSVDTVTVTIGGKAPIKYINGEDASNNAIQSVLDSTNTQPGDLIMVGPGTYNEMLIMWKPVRLQGVGAASVVINANAHPSGKIDGWRREVACLFGLSLNGGAISATNPFDPNGTFTCSSTMQRKVDPIPFESLVGWDPNFNGNLAELLQEPTVLGAYEGAGITVFAKGVADVNGQADPSCTANGICTMLTASPADCSNYPSNFLCNPSRIDGMTFTNSSQGGGGMLLHGWDHYLEIANNRVYGNAGTLSGGITVGQPETTDGTIVGTTEQPFGYNIGVHLHHNSVTQNASYGDELNSTTPMAAGGVTMCTGADNYLFNYNWICGNLSAGDGAGFVHYGLSANANISNNSILFNQSTNPTIPTHGGGVAILGKVPDGTVCENAATDQDCAPELSDGAGPGLVIDSNLILGNTAESGSGGGLRLQQVNGTEVARNALNPENWYGVLVINNIIANNVAGWDGGGVSIQDSLKVDFINNTVSSNDSTASAGVLFNALGAANANTPPPGCSPQADPTQPQNPSCIYQVAPTNPQAAGLVTMAHTAPMTASLPATIKCPSGHFSGSDPSNANCRQISYPLLLNDMFWQNRAFNIQVGGPGTGTQSQQNVIALVPTLNQTSTGNCPSGASYWDIGVRGDSGAGDHGSGQTLTPANSILTSYNGGYSGNGNLAPSTSPVISPYCNGSRVPPENGGMGYNVPAGISDATLPNPIFNLTAAATVDEGNNWVNMVYGPLSLFSPSNVLFGNYLLPSGSPAINAASSASAPNHDIFGTARPQGGGFDIGAVEFITFARVNMTPSALIFATQNMGTTSTAQTVTLTNSGTSVQAINASILSTDFTRPTGVAGGTCGTSLPVGGSCTINVTFTPSAIGARSATLNVTGVGSVFLSGTGATPPTTLSPTTLTFTGQNINTTSAPQTVTVSNPGALSQAISVSFSTTEFARPTGTAGGTCSFSVAPGASCSINVTFRPTAVGSRIATLTVANVGSVSLSGTGVTQPATLIPSTVTFAAQNVGSTSASQGVTVSNPGTTAQAINIAFSTTEFARPAGAAGGSCGTSVAAGASCTINVTFTPAAAGARTGTLTVSGVGSATLNGTGAVASVSVSPNTLTFASQNVGSTSASQAVTVSNTGVTTQSIGMSFSTTEFARPSGSAGGTCTNSIGAGSNCTINVTFKPAATGSRTATLTIANAGTVSLTGTGTAAALTVSPSTLTFAARNVGTTSSSQGVSVSNPGSSAQSLSISFSTTEFAQPSGVAGGTCGTSIGAFGNCTINVTFTPAAAGARTASLSINGFLVNLSGTGTVSSLTASPTTLTFGSQNVGSTSASQAVTVSNTGSTSQTITISFSTSEFARPTGTPASGTCGSTLSAGTNCTINVVFRPSSAGTRTATLTVTNAGTVSLTGTGSTVPATVAPSTLTFASQKVGTTSASQSLTITNSGTLAQPVSLAFSTPEFARPNVPFGGSCGTSVAAGSSCTVTVAFTPSSTGARTAILTLSGIGSVNLNGTGN